MVLTAAHVVEVRSAEVLAATAVFLTAAVVLVTAFLIAVVLTVAVRSVVDRLVVDLTATAADLAEVARMVAARMATVVIAKSKLQHPDLSIHHTLNFAH